MTTCNSIYLLINLSALVVQCMFSIFAKDVYKYLITSTFLRLTVFNVDQSEFDTAIQDCANIIIH